jgi:hypothetical protein
MAEMETSKYIITESYKDEDAEKKGRTLRKRESGKPYAERLIWLDDEVIKGASYAEVIFFPTGIKSDKPIKRHIHEFDEIIAFLGTNPEKPRELGGEVELWLEDDKHIITKSCLVYVPKGMRHCPLEVLKVDYPIIHFTLFTNGGDAYLWKDVD